MAALRALMLLAIATAAGTAVWVTHRHYADRDAERALVLANTFRFAGTTTSRLDAWLGAHRPNARIAWRSDRPGPFAAHVAVTLELDGIAHRFRVDPSARTVEPDGDPATGLIDRLRRDTLTK